MLIRLLVAAGGALICAAAFTLAASLWLERAYPANGAFASVAGGRLHYTEKNPAAGAPRAVVLLIHGASGSQADLMVPLGDRLAAKGFRVIAFDRPGLGWSDRPDGAADASPARQAELLHQAAKEIGVSRAIIVAHSLGGAAGAQMAIEYPRFAQGLVLISAVTHPWPGGVAWYYRAAAAPYLGWAFVRLAALPAGLIAMPAALKGVFSPAPVPPHYAQRVGAALILTPTRFHANAQDVLSLQDFVHTLPPRLPSISAPTAIITGDEDGVVSPQLHSFTAAREIPGASLTVLHGVGHSPHWAQPDAVVAAIVGVADRSDLSTPARAGVSPAAAR